MKKAITIIFACAMLVILCVGFVGCKTTFKMRSAIETPKEFEYDVLDNLNISGIDEQLLENPDRGFRGETYITLGAGEAYPESKDEPFAAFDRELSFENANIQIMQGYVYLIEYYNQDLPQTALDELKRYFEHVQKSGAKLLLRFAYEYTETDDRGPSTKQITKHCAQLKQWFDDNLALTYDVVYAMQLGMIGLWGEGHHSAHNHNVKTIIKAVNDMTPEKLTIMVRTPQFLSQVPEKDRGRFTVHDDFLVGEYHPWGMLNFDHPQYNQLCSISRTSISDGEMPWGRDKTVDNINPILFLKQVVEYGLTTLSLKHNYMDEDDYSAFELHKWRSEYITAEQLKDNHFPYNPNMLTNGKISIFDYINYHLGYQIALSNYSLSGGSLQFIVNNFGFAAPLGYNMEVLVNGKVVSTTSAASMGLYQFCQYKVNIDVGNIAQNATIGVRWVSERDGSMFKVANNIAYTNGINYIK